MASPHEAERAHTRTLGHTQTGATCGWTQRHTRPRPHTPSPKRTGTPSEAERGREPRTHTRRNVPQPRTDVDLMGITCTHTVPEIVCARGRRAARTPPEHGVSRARSWKPAEGDGPAQDPACTRARARERGEHRVRGRRPPTAGRRSGRAQAVCGHPPASLCVFPSTAATGVPFYSHIWPCRTDSPTFDSGSWVSL